MTDLERPKTPGSVKVAGVVALGLLGWLLFGSALSVGRAVIALAGYVIVGVVAFNAGKFVGRHGNRD